MSDACKADEIVRLRASKIRSVNSAISRDVVFENVQDTQNAFNFLFINVSDVYTDVPMEQLIDITRYIMANNPNDVIAALSVTPPLSTAALISLKRLANLAKSALEVQ